MLKNVKKKQCFRFRFVPSIMYNIQYEKVHSLVCDLEIHLWQKRQLINHLKCHICYFFRLKKTAKNQSQRQREKDRNMKENKKVRKGQRIERKKGERKKVIKRKKEETNRNKEREGKK